MFVTSSQRSPTNKVAIYLSIALLILLFIVVGICFFDGTIYRTINGYDDCGNICGMKNEQKVVNIPGHCQALDMTSKPFFEQGEGFIVGDKEYNHAECVASCGDDYIEIANNCIKKKGDSHPSADQNDIDFEVVMSKSWKPIMLSVMVAAVFSFIVLVLFRYYIKQIIWGLYIGLIVIKILVCIGFIIATTITKDPMVLIIAAVFGISAVVTAVLLYLFRDRIKLVVEIFKETSRALSDIAPLLFQPVLTMIAIIIYLTVFAYFSLVIVNSGSLEPVDNENGNFELARYEPAEKGTFSMIFNCFFLYWFLNFIFGFQHFIIASAVCQWYFTRDKTKLSKPMSRAYSHLFRFHLGTLFLGSLLITIVKIILGILRAAARDSESSSGFQRIFAACIRALLDMLEELLEFLLRNAYIIVALKGTSIVPSGKKAIGLLKENLIDVIALNKFGDFVMVMARIFVAVFTGILCYTLIPDVNGQSIGGYGAFIAAVLGFLIIHCFMTVFEMAVDTIFICFCVDCEENDGVNQQYYMSPKLMKAMQEIKSFTGGKNNFSTLPPQFQVLNTSFPSQQQYMNPAYPTHPPPSFNSQMNNLGDIPQQKLQMNQDPSYPQEQPINPAYPIYPPPSFNSEMINLPPQIYPGNPEDGTSYPQKPSTPPKYGFNV